MASLAREGARRVSPGCTWRRSHREGVSARAANVAGKRMSSTTSSPAEFDVRARACDEAVEAGRGDVVGQAARGASRAQEHQRGPRARPAHSGRVSWGNDAVVGVRAVEVQERSRGALTLAWRAGSRHAATPRRRRWGRRARPALCAPGLGGDGLAGGLPAHHGRLSLVWLGDRAPTVGVVVLVGVAHLVDGADLGGESREARRSSRRATGPAPPSRLPCWGARA